MLTMDFGGELDCIDRPAPPTYGEFTHYENVRQQLCYANKITNNLLLRDIFQHIRHYIIQISGATFSTLMDKLIVRMTKTCISFGHIPMNDRKVQDTRYCCSDLNIKFRNIHILPDIFMKQITIPDGTADKGYLRYSVVRNNEHSDGHDDYPDNIVYDINITEFQRGGQFTHRAFSLVMKDFYYVGTDMRVQGFSIRII